MKYLYLTVGKEARAEQIIEKSKFIVSVRPVESREDAEGFFDSIRKEFKDATHNVPAMVIGEKMQIQWGSDDGEPQGTSGAPIVQFLVSKEITNVALMVTRYFGGIKLGTGGLVRAYTSSAELGIDEAGIVGVTEYSLIKARADYGVYNRFISYRFPEELKSVFKFENPEFGEKVVFDISCRIDRSEEAKSILMEISGGQLDFLTEGIILKHIPLTR